MTRKSILITGCSSGIGLDAAHSLQARGWQVFAACRKAEDCARLHAQGFVSPLIDYNQPDTITAGLDEVLTQTGGRLDALFNNGGHGLFGAVEDVTTEGLRDIFESNLFGWHSLTRAVLPVMRAQGGGRILQCSSILGQVTIPWRGAYAASKHALEALTDTLRIEMRGTGIHVILIEPGPITSRFRENGQQYFERFTDWRNSPRRTEYETVLRPRLYQNSGPDPFELPASAVSAKVIRALDARNPAPRYFVTLPTWVGVGLRRVLSTRMLDRIAARF